MFKRSGPYLICHRLRGRASSSLPPLLTARCRDSLAPAALGLCCLHPQLGTAGAPRRVTLRGELPQRGFSPPQPANYFHPSVSTAQEITRAPAASAAPRPEQLWSWPRRAQDRGKGVPHRLASGLGATNPVPLRSPVKATVRIVQALLRGSSSWRPVALCKPRWGLKNASVFCFFFSGFSPCILTTILHRVRGREPVASRKLRRMREWSQS